MSDSLIQHKLELAAAAYLATEIAGLATVRLTEDDGAVLEAQSIYAMCPRADGVQTLPGNYNVTLTVELRTELDLYSDRAAAVAAHFVLWPKLADAMMQDDLATGLVAAGSGFGINGIEDTNQLEQSCRSGVLTNSITRTVSAVSRTIT